MKFDWRYIWINLIILVLAYLIGSINISILLSKRMGKDIRQIGSNNAGTTNALRNFGPGFGLQVFIFDLLKSFIPCLFLVLLQRYMIKTSTNFSYVIPLVAGIGIVIGHIFPIFFKFKGGKGVACFFGIVLTFHIVLFILLFIFYIIILLMFRYVSLASTLSSIVISLLSYIPFYYDHNILISFANQNVYWPLHSICLVIVSALILLMHIPNYIRISNKEESIFDFYKYMKNNSEQIKNN